MSRWFDSKGNGGATAPGVTATEIKVAFPVTNSESTWPKNKPIVDFFNSRFRHYDRKIRIVPVHSLRAIGNATGDWNNPSLQRPLDAAQIAASKVFATLDYSDHVAESAALPPFYDAMAKAKIVTAADGDVRPLDTLASLTKRTQYAWTYAPSAS